MRPKTSIFLRFFKVWCGKHRFSLGFSTFGPKLGTPKVCFDCVYHQIGAFWNSLLGGSGNDVSDCWSDPPFHAPGAKMTVVQLTPSNKYKPCGGLKPPPPAALRHMKSSLCAQRSSKTAASARAFFCRFSQELSTPLGLPLTIRDLVDRSCNLIQTRHFSGA